jgi:hypothetical protein
MSTQFFDVSVAKEYETIINGKPERKTKWRQVGTAWPSKSGESLLIELFLIPNERYLINFKKGESTKPNEPAPGGLLNE